MTAEERTQRLSEVFDAMEAGEATIDDWWATVFPTLEWCEYERKETLSLSNATKNWFKEYNIKERESQILRSMPIPIIVAVGLFATHTRDAKQIASLLNITSAPSIAGRHAKNGKRS